MNGQQDHVCGMGVLLTFEPFSFWKGIMKMDGYIRINA